MNQKTPEKHKTPNYRQVCHTITVPHPLAVLGFKQMVLKRWAWEPMPLRATRKDLK